MTMFNFLCGCVATAVLYTFFPKLAAKPSEWLVRARDAWRNRA
jgi:hypothetical protein